MKLVFLAIAAVVCIFLFLGLRSGCGKVTQKVGWRKTPAQKLKLSGQELIGKIGSTAKSAGKIAEPFAKAGAKELARQHPRTGVGIVNEGLKKVENWGTGGEEQVKPGELQFKAGGQIVTVDSDGRTELVTPAPETTTVAPKNSNGIPWYLWFIIGAMGITILLLVRRRRVVTRQSDNDIQDDDLPI